MHRDDGDRPAIMQDGVPAWKKRRWMLFKVFIQRPYVQDHIRKYRPQVVDQDIKPLAALAPLFDDDMPEGCAAAYEYLLYNENADDNELFDLIESPIKYFSHMEKSAGPTKKEAKREYEELMHNFRKLMKEHDEHFNFPFVVEEKLLNYDDGIYLKIEPFTSQKEIVSFIEANYRKFLRPLLEKQSVLGNRQPVQITKPRASVRPTTGDISARLVELQKEGKTAYDMIPIIDEEFGKVLDPAAIYKRISRAKSPKK